MFDGLHTPASIKGRVRVYEQADPENTLYQRDNVIVNGVAYLFSRLMVNSAEPVAGVWGLALGSGGSAGGWSASTQPDPTAIQTAMVSPITRKALTNTTYIDGSGNSTTALTTKVNFQTILNATTDAITVPIREMGLIGGGTTLKAFGGPSNMLTAPFFDPKVPAMNSVILINYITIPSLVLPPSINIGVDWLLSFGGGGTTPTGFQPIVYWGVSASTTLSNNDVIVGLGFQDFAANFARTIVYNCSLGVYPYYCYPASFGLPSAVFVDGMAFSDYVVTTQNVTSAQGYGLSYYLIRFANLQHGAAIGVQWS